MERERKPGDAPFAPLRVLPGQNLSQIAPDVKEQVYAIWSTLGGMNAAATERRYADLAGEGVPIPTQQTINQWARDGHWREQRDEDFRKNHGARLYALQVGVLAVMEGHIDVSLRAQAGEWDHNPAGGIVRLRPGELWGRAIERGIVGLIPDAPATTGERTFETLEEKEAFLRGEVAGRKGKR